MAKDHLSYIKYYRVIRMLFMYNRLVYYEPISRESVLHIPVALA